VTGTKGKSTTSSLLAHMLVCSGKEAYLCGNIGTSVFEYLEIASPRSIFVLELSSYQLSDMPVSPHISLCINLYFDHVDWHGSLEAYWEAKHTIMRFAGPDDYFVYNPEFEALRDWAAHATCQTVTFGPDEAIDMSRSKLLGAHNRLNAIAARTTAKLAGATDEGVQKAIDTFKPLEHRLEVVTEREGVTFIDDGIATTPEATLAAIDAVTKDIGPVGCIMLGGEDRGSDFGALLRMCAQQQIANIVFFPPSGERMRQELPEGYEPTVLVTRDMDEAVKFAADNTVSGEVVLLSTASASYSIWPLGFPQKGEFFKQAIAKL
jgi:UDP-N-acetylmuramoylalanine--D-glutamate ligase